MDRSQPIGTQSMERMDKEQIDTQKELQDKLKLGWINSES